MNHSEKITFSIAGLFHYHNYLRFLAEDNAIEKVYFSHRIGSLGELRADLRCNLALKEYLMYAHIRLLGANSAFRWMNLYNQAWRLQSGAYFAPSRLNLVLLQGNSHHIFKRIRNEGCVSIGEAVNAHPTALKSILSDDAKLHGVEPFWSDSIYSAKLSELDLVDYILCPSRFVASSYISAGFAPDKVLTIPYGSTSTLANKGLPRFDFAKDKRAAKIIVVGQVFPRKGQYHLVKALKENCHGLDFELTLIGLANGDYLKAIRNLGVPFKHFNHMPHADVLTKISEHDVLCLNSLEDGFGMVVTEALSLGVPVAVSQNAGASELITRCGGGVVFDPLDPSSTINAITACLCGDFKLQSEPLPSWREYATELTQTIGFGLAGVRA